MTHMLRALSALSKDPGLIPCIHMTTPVPGIQYSLPASVGTKHVCAHRHMCRQNTCTCKIKQRARVSYYCNHFEDGVAWVMMKSSLGSTPLQSLQLGQLGQFVYPLVPQFPLLKIELMMSSPLQGDLLGLNGTVHMRLLGQGLVHNES